MLHELKHLGDILNAVKASPQAQAQVTPTPASGASGVQAFKPIHFGVWCNCCGKQNITGARYKCLFCKDTDMCEECEAKPNMHDPSHSFIKIKDTGAFNSLMEKKPQLFNAV